MNRMKAFRS